MPRHKKGKKVSKTEKELMAFKGGKVHHEVKSSVKSITAKNAIVAVDASKVRLTKRKGHKKGSAQMSLPFSGKGIKIPTLMDKGGNVFPKLKTPKFGGFSSAEDYRKEMSLPTLMG